MGARIETWASPGHTRELFSPLPSMAGGAGGVQLSLNVAHELEADSTNSRAYVSRLPLGAQWKNMYAMKMPTTIAVKSAISPQCTV